MAEAYDQGRAGASGQRRRRPVDISGGEGLQLGVGRALHGHDAAGLAGDARLEEVARQAGVAKEDQLHFNVNALQRPLPFGTTFSTNGVLAPGSTGNLGNVPWGALRNPGWSNWDFTLSRRFPVKWSDSHTGNLRVQLQFYNVFNQVEFNRLGAIYALTSANATGGFGGENTNSQTCKYVDTQPPFNGGITIRFDF